MKKTRVIVQYRLFGDDEIIKMTRKKPMQYSSYMRGAVDMFLRILNSGVLPEKQSRLRNLPRKYMQAVCEKIMEDPEEIKEFVKGGKFRFSTERDYYGTIKSVNAKIGTNKRK